MAIVKFPQLDIRRFAFSNLTPLILTVFFISGACGLVYEVVWLKMLSVVFGSTALATTIILAAFMGGLAIGNYRFGRLADRAERPLRLYAWLELGIGLFAFIMPLILGLLDDVYIFAYQNFTSSYLWLSLVRLIMSFMVLLVPTFLMGGTLPVLVRFLFSRFGGLGYRVSQLYFINTIGAAFGTIVTGFLLVAVLGINQSAYLAGALNLTIALVFFILDTNQPKSVLEMGAASTGFSTAPVDSPTEAYPSGVRRLALWAIGVSGFCSLAYEVLWTRALIYLLDNTAQAFTTMLAAFLIGIALGSLIVSRWIDRSRHLLLAFSVAEIMIGLLALLSIPIFGNLGAALGADWGNAYYPTSNQWVWALFRFMRSFIVMLLPTLLMGIALPLAVKIYSGGTGGAAAGVGKSLAVNTLAGVAGSFGAGFLLIPGLGVFKSVVVVAALNVTVGLVLLSSLPAWRLRKKVAASLGAGLSYVVTLAILISYGGFMFSSPIERENMAGVLYYNEGIGATVKVYQDYFMNKSISIDGFPVAGTITRHVDAQKSLGHLPLLLTQNPHPSVGIIGFGAGGSSWAAMQYDTADVDCIELLPAVLEAAEFIPEVNHGVMTDPRLELIFADGRNHMLVTDKTYDIISVDATSPKSSGSGSLYTMEFYQLCQQKLAADGLMIQWLPYHLLSEEDVKMTARTFQQVFPHASLWFSFQRHYYILVGTQQELEIDFQQLSAWTSRANIQDELVPLGIKDAYDVLACFILDEHSLAQYSAGSRLNTDNHPYLEYAPNSAYLVIDNSVRQNLKAIAPLRQSVCPYVVNTGATPSQSQLVELDLLKRMMTTRIEDFWPDYVN